MWHAKMGKKKKGKDVTVKKTEKICESHKKKINFLIMYVSGTGKSHTNIRRRKQL